jgi:peptide-methionine (R)-S-oxide reductase
VPNQLPVLTVEVPGNGPKPNRSRRGSTARSRRNSVCQERKIWKTDAEWKEQLTPEQFAVTREAKDTETEGGAYVTEEKTGVYLCVCCEEPLFDSSKKYKSPDGRAAFYGHLGMVSHTNENAELKKADAICNRCGAYIGTVDMNGPEPTGIHFSVNSTAINFIFAEEEKIDESDARNAIMSPDPPHDKKLEELERNEFERVVHALDTPKGKDAAPRLHIDANASSTPQRAGVQDIRTMLQSPVPQHATGKAKGEPAFFAGVVDLAMVDEGPSTPAALAGLKSPPRRPKAQ